MNTTFKIPSTSANNNIVIEIGTSNIALLCYSTYPFTASGFYYFTITAKDTLVTVAEEIKIILQNENLLAADQVNIFYNYADTTLVPATYFKASSLNSIAALMFGSKTDSEILYETISIQNIENIYAVPYEIKNTISALYPHAKIMHSLSKAIQLTNGTKLLATVYDTEIRLVLFKENMFMLATYFDYSTPEDVCYHLLNVCERYKVPADDVEVILNGMIDTNSNLYREIYKFFLHTSIEQMPEKTILAENFEGMNAHYFSPLVKLAKCVS